MNFAGRRLYADFLKRVLDFLLALAAIVLLSPLLLALTVLGAVMMHGNPFFAQPRPGRGERVFLLVKFRTMTDASDADGNLLPDEARLNAYGRFLRASSLDELPELLNVVRGDMALVGPRPQLVRDMVFMTPEQRRRHSVRQGITGLAQVNGRNAVSWEEKLDRDLEYVRDITFPGDLKILLATVSKVLRREGVAEEGRETATDFGDYLLASGKIDRSEYDRGQEEAKRLLDAAVGRARE